MDDLTGTPAERLAHLQDADSSRRDPAWLERQLRSALEGWQSSDDEVRKFREAQEDF